MLRACDYTLILVIIFIALNVLWVALPHTKSDLRGQEILELIVNSEDVAWLSVGTGAALIVNLISDFLFLPRTETFEKKLRAAQTSFLLVFLMLPSVVILAVHAGQARAHRLLDAFVCAVAVRRMAFIGSFVVGLLDSPSDLFTRIPVLFTALCFLTEMIALEVESVYHFVEITGARYLLLIFGFATFSWLVWRYIRHLLSLKTVPYNEQGTLVMVTCAMLSLITNLTGRSLALSSWELLLHDQISWLVIATIAVLVPGKIESRYLLSIATNLLEMKKGFVRYVSHEVRTPLNVATVGMAMLTEDVSALLSVEQKSVMAQVKEGIDAAIEVLSELLTYDKITSNLMTLEKTKVEVLELLTSSLSMFRLQAQQKSVAFHLTFTEEASAAKLSNRVLEIDAHKIRQVLRNFASNAVKFTPTGGCIEVRAFIERRAAPRPPRADSESQSSLSSAAVALLGLGQVSLFHGSLSQRSTDGVVNDGKEWLIVEVQDSGAGLSPENLPRIFHEIVQFNANKLQDGKGTGLGLYISSNIVELHGGTVSVQSEGEGKGCLFSMAIPLTDERRSVHSVSLRSALFDPWNAFVSAQSREENSIPNSRSIGRDDGPTIKRVMDLPMVGSFAKKPVAIGESPRSASIRSSVKVLPIEDDRVISFDSCPTKSESLDNHVATKRMRALVADDSNTSAKMVAMYLRRLNVDVVVVGDGAAALEEVRRSLEAPTDLRPCQSFDFVLMDNHMPKMDGPTACLNMREIGFSSPVFGLTGDGSAEETSAYISAGANKVFTKPLDVSALKKTLVSCNLHAEKAGGEAEIFV